MLIAKNITHSFDRRIILDQVSFQIQVGEKVGLVGPSGSGKSVLLKILGGVLKPDYGQVQISRTERPNSQNTRSRAVGFLFQEGALFDSLSVIDNVATPLLVKRDVFSDDESFEGEKEFTRQEALSQAHDMLVNVGLGDSGAKFPGQLSGGMRRRVGIARALVGSPELLLFDDPTGGLDPIAARVIMELILRLQETYNPSIVIVSHDIRRLLPNVDRLISLFDGRLTCDCSAASVLSEGPAELVQFLRTRFDFEGWQASA